MYIPCISRSHAYSGGYAQAICGEIPEPAARSWNTREASGRYWTNRTATCGFSRPFHAAFFVLFKGFHMFSLLMSIC